MEDGSGRNVHHHDATYKRVKPTLTGVSPQLNDKQPVPLPNHPSAFTFPNLNLDGSLTDHHLTSHQSSPFTYTPPAALSSLGARIRMSVMAEGNSNVTDSFIDEQYDMIDDLSEISNDDHETASIASESAGQDTPDLMDSITDLDEEANFNGQVPAQQFDTSLNVPTVQTGVRVTHKSTSDQEEQDKAGDFSHDSFLSEDLDTPRQSAMPLFASTVLSKSLAKADAAAVTTANAAATSPTLHAGQEPSPKQSNTILFVADKFVNNADMERVLTSVAHVECLDDTNPSSPTEIQAYNFTRPTATPSGDNAPTAKILRSGNSVSASIYHCVGAERRAIGSYSMRVLDSDSSHSSIYTIGQDGKIDLPTPNIAVFLIERFTKASAWLQIAHEAISALNIPVLIVRGSDFKSDHLRRHVPRPGPMLAQTTKQRHIDIVHFHDTDITPAMGVIKELLYSRGKFGAKVVMKWLYTIFISMVFLLFGLSAFSIMPNMSSNSRDLLQARRHALSNSTSGLQDYSVDHLLPSYMADCFNINTFGLQRVDDRVTHDTYNCSSVFFDVVTPNHFIVALPGLSRFPSVTSLRVYKKYTGDLLFNQTELIPGVYDISFDPSEAYGIVHLHMVTSNPPLNVTSRHNFASGGSNTIKDVSKVLAMDVSKILAKDVAVAREAALSLTDRLQTEFGALSKTLTKELVVARRDVAKFSKDLSRDVSKLGKDLHRDVSKLSKDLHRDVSELGKELSLSIRSRVTKSRERMHEIKEKLAKKAQEGYKIRKTKKACKKAAKGKKG